MMLAVDDSSPLSQVEDDKEGGDSMERGEDGEITIELYQHNKSGGANHTKNMALGSDDESAWGWIYSCFGCRRRSGTNFERIRLGEKQEFVVNKMADSRGGGREPTSPRNTFSGTGIN